MPWTTERVLAAAPDAASVKAGRKLAVPGPWTGTGSNDSLVWGSCQGSGKTPYQVSVDVVAPAYKCTCPSRKFPCKHAIALLLLWSDGLLDGGPAADFAEAWARKRSTATEPATASRSAPDPEAAAARRRERIAKMDAGVDEFSLWLTDIVRGGLAAAIASPDTWDRAAARLVDAQLPGLADRVRDTGADAARGTADPAELLERVGEWWTASRAWIGRDRLDSGLQADLRTYLGWPIPTADVRAGEVREGSWTVAGTHREDSGRLEQQRTWLLDEATRRYWMLLETAGPGQALGVPQRSGAVLRARVGVYPGAGARRILFVDPPDPVGASTDLGPGVDVRTAFRDCAHAVAAVPWRDRHPVALADVAVAGPERDHLVDVSGAAVELTPDTDRTLLLAISGGRADVVFGELTSGRFRALSVRTGDVVRAL